MINIKGGFTKDVSEATAEISSVTITASIRRAGYDYFLSFMDKLLYIF